MLSHLWRELHHVFLLTTGDTRVLRSRGRSCCGWHHFSQSNPRQLGSSQCEMPAPCSRSSSIYHPFFHCVPTLSSSIFEPPASGGALLALRGTEITVPRQWATWDRDLALWRCNPALLLLKLEAMIKSALQNPPYIVIYVTESKSQSLTRQHVAFRGSGGPWWLRKEQRRYGQGKYWQEHG